MANEQTKRAPFAPGYTGPRLFGAPVGDFSVLQTLLIVGATGVASFFAATFLAIVTLLVLTQALHRNLDFSLTYRWVGLPVGVVMLLLAAVYFGVVLLRRLRHQGAR